MDCESQKEEQQKREQKKIAKRTMSPSLLRYDSRRRDPIKVALFFSPPNVKIVIMLLQATDNSTATLWPSHHCTHKFDTSLRYQPKMIWPGCLVSARSFLCFFYPTNFAFSLQHWKLWAWIMRFSFAGKYNLIICQVERMSVIYSSIERLMRNESSSLIKAGTDKFVCDSKTCLSNGFIRCATERVW